ncbi:MAG: LysR family transcriptional regulator [Halobacteriovoraceae bacterium]|nr:LysR family transcriptional regulator [Halobacteriovoraceae bacterium]
MERLNFSHLYYFYVVAKEGSIKQASEKLHVTQPTISDQIKLLEEYFDQRLFERKNRSLQLNRSGTIVLEYAEKIFELSGDLTVKVRDGLDFPKKTLDIGITYKMSHYFLYDTILPLFGFEDVAINVKEGERHRLMADLENGEVDLVFTHEKEVGNRKLNSYNLGENKTYVVCHKKLQKLIKRFPEDLNNLEYFGYAKDSQFRFEIEMFFNRFNLFPKPLGEGDDIDLHQMVVEKGLAFSIVPEVAALRFIKNKKVVILGEIAEMKTSVWGIIRSDYKGLGYRLLNNTLS